MSMEVCVECCITSQDRAGRLLWDSLSKNCLTACTTNKSSHLEVSYSSEVPLLPAIPSDFCEHFLRMGDCEGLQGSCQLFHSPCCGFSLSQYPTFYWVYCGNHVQWGQDDALSLGRLLFPRCQCGLEAERTRLSHGSLRDEISPARSHRAQILWSACPYAAESHALQQFCISTAWWWWWWWPKGV